MLRIFRHYISRLQLFVYMTEILILFLSAFFAILTSLSLFTYAETSQSFEITHLYYDSIIYTVILHISMIAIGLYQKDLIPDAKTLCSRILLSLAVGAVAYNVLAALFQLNTLGYHSQILAYTFTFASIFSFRMLVFSDIETKSNASKIFILGTGDKAVELRNELISKGKQSPFNDSENQIAGFIKLADTEVNQLIKRDLVIDANKPGLLRQYALKQNVKEIIIALDERRKRLPIDELMDCKLNGIKITDIADFLERETGYIELDSFRPNNLIFSDGAVQSIRFKTKRLIDIIGSFFILFATTPIMLAASIMIYIESGFKGSILYRQTRVGLNGKPFEILKFRSMIENAEKGNKAVWAQQNDVRVTRFGKFMRKTRIDELPQLYNVLKGEMSLVGPRPERPQFVEELSSSIQYYNLRHYAMPGITGWAQTCYPYGASIEDSRKKLEYDLYYVKNYSAFLDLLILFQTVAVVIWGKGAR